jgi:hypothetical protein
MFSPARTAMTVDADDPQWLTICREDGMGLCIRALRACASGRVIHRFTGEVGPHMSQHSLQVRPDLHIAATRYIGYLSHGCDPNCRLDMGRFELVALREIAAGEILTIDYAATEDRLYAQFSCACAAADCRRWITGRIDPVNATGRAYLAAHDPATASA